MARLAIERQTATHITIDGRELVAFGGCNYLGLGSDARVAASLSRAAALHGLSTTASRETTGNSLVHEALERELAGFVGQEAAILSAEGYTANFVALQTIARTCRVALIDEHAHRSLRHAAVAAGLQVFAYEHLSPESAGWLARQHADQGVAILTDSVFAADGAVAPLPGLLSCLPATRSVLVVDDCHGFCVLGNGGRGAVDHFGMRDPRVVITTTLAKGLGCYGGAVLGSRAFVESAQEHAWVYRSSTPLPPAIAQACRTAIEILRSEPVLVDRLRANASAARAGLMELGLPVPASGVPIFTFGLTPAARMEKMHRMMADLGVFAPVIAYPGGPGERYFRVVVNAAHSPEDVRVLLRVLRDALANTREMLGMEQELKPEGRALLRG
jgi:8-amino-7-oxononanoate synthase